MKRKQPNYESLFNACIGFIEHYAKKELFEGGLYPTQRAICRAMVYNTFSRNGRMINASLTRQYGKSTIVFLTSVFLAIFAPSVLGYPINIGISVPQRSQAKQNMDKIREIMKRILPDFDMSFEENNKTDIRLSNGSVFYVFSLEDGSNNESRTLHISIVDEAHKINDEKYNREIRPMMSNTNGNEVFIGVGGTRVCEFYSNLQDTSGQMDTFKFNFLDALAEKKIRYEETQDERHLFYEKKVNGTEESKGLHKDSDEFRTEYMLEWILGVGNFITREELLAMKMERLTVPVQQIPNMVCYAGLDFAKHGDSTVLTIVAVHEGKVKVIAWQKYKGDYQIQFDSIKRFTSKYKIAKFYIDSTGVGDGIADFFGTFVGANRIERVVFTAPSKDNMYKNLSLVFQDGFEYYNDTEHSATFEKEFCDLQKEYKGNYLSVHHPEGNGYHDDYTDSLALACLFKSAKNNVMIGNLSR